MTTSTSCMAMHDHGYICTKPPGHTGEHGAFMPDGTAIATWTDHGAITTSPAPPVAAPTAPATAPDAEPYFDQDGNLIRSKASPDGRIVHDQERAVGVEAEGSSLADPDLVQPGPAPLDRELRVPLRHSLFVCHGQAPTP